ncbi:hypothetical protein HNQ60_001366 [Povalibacter uvarum]|uniref:Uncharacterized protein n=1 Tax=Povalibacter uvarum TaxID=732238 RepID=A0A841HJT0_9GAMM|nr:hypothetical protein [Povalibacter uvarum]MBB6092488.1 hypothetical protein [Povalibacter uvarum]
MRTAALIIATFTLSALDADAADPAKQTPIPDHCPVTLPTEPLYVAPGEEKAVDPARGIFLYGTDALFTQLASDGRWTGIKSATGTRNKSAWFRKDAQWGDERPYQLVVTAKRIDANRPMITVPRVTNMLVGKEQQEVAMLLMLELPERGCWEVTGNYKSDYLSFIVWLD